VSLAVPPGSLCALIGPNGAGKTTLFNVATNLFAPTSGEVRFFGDNAAGLSPQRVAALGIMRTFQTARVFPGMTTLENVMVGAHRQLRSSAVAQMFWTV
jgi:branched-chain amino acid transport system ATP-binding protein